MEEVIKQSIACRYLTTPKTLYQIFFILTKLMFKMDMILYCSAAYEI